MKGKGWRIWATALAAALLVGGCVMLWKDAVLQRVTEQKVAVFSPAGILEANKQPATIPEPTTSCSKSSEQPSQNTTAATKCDENTMVLEDSRMVLQGQAAKLQERYPDAIGWLYVPGTSIDYPVMQSGDNAFYLKHAPDGTSQNCGSVFLDYRCEGGFRNNYNILYSHNMCNGSMFADVCKFKDESFFAQHPHGYLTTPDAVYVLDFFSVAVTDWMDSIYNGYLPLSERVPHIREISRIYDEIKLDEPDQLVSLSTCSYEYENARTVLTGRLLEVIV